MKNGRKFGIIAVIALFCVIFCNVNKTEAQVLEVGVTGGLSSYYGDLNPIIPFNQAKFGFGGMVRYYQSSRWAFRFAYSNMTITATDEKVGIKPERGLGFKTNLNDFSLIAEFNFLDYITGSRRNFITPYLFAGVSFVTFNPKALDGTELYNILTDVNSYKDKDGNVIHADGTITYVDTNNPSHGDFNQNASENGGEKYSRFSGSLPFGLGVKYSVNRRIGLALEWRVHWAWTDWLDDCSGYYPYWNDGDAWAQYADPSGKITEQLGGNDIGFLQRGDSVKYDFYSFLNFTVAFKFNLPKSKKCNVGTDKKYSTYY